MPSDGSVWDWRLEDFRDRTASDSPTPGGGSAAMVAAATGLGLVLMALRVTARRPETGDRLADLILSGERRLVELSGYADADIAVFEQYMAALRLPKETEDEKATRRDAMAEAAVAATEVPLNSAQAVLEALDLARQAVEVAHHGIVSDVAAGSAILRGALTAVLYNVDINLKSIRDPAAAAEYAASRGHLQRAGEDRAETVGKIAAERLGS